MGDLSYVRMFLSVDQPADMFRGYPFVTALARRDDHRIAAYLEELQQAEASLRQLLDGLVQGEASAATAHLAEPRGQVGQKVNAGWRAVVSGG